MTGGSVVAPADRYAPEFQVEIEGLAMDPAAKCDITSVRVTQDLEALSGFSLTLNNWDDRTLKFKYSDSKKFTVGRRVTVRLGYADKLLCVMSGKINTLSPSFPEGGSPIVTVSGVDALVGLKSRKPSDSEKKLYEKVADWQIAQQIAARNNLQAVVTREGPIYEQVVQQDQDDLTFLRERAGCVDFDCFLQTDPDSGAGTLYFVQPKDGRSGPSARTFQLAYGPGLATGPGNHPADLLPNLLSFDTTMTLSGQVGKLTVRGWDRTKKEAIEYTATASDLPSGPDGGGGEDGPKLAASSLPARRDVVVDAVVASKEEAKALAVSMLRNRAYRFLTGSGRVAGLPELRPADSVEIYGLGHRFSGTYFVTSVEHTLNSSGFFTAFKGRRVHSGGAA